MPTVKLSEATLTRSKLPAGMHNSWFDRPEFAVGTAICDRGGCQCGEIRRGHDSGLNFAVADSLYLDGNWHRYEAAIAQLQSASTGAAQARELEAGVSDAACDILISQETLKRFGDEALRSMRTKARNAEDRGSDYPELCDTETPSESSDDSNDLARFDMASFKVFDEQACERYTDLIRYRNMVNDAQALRMPRTGVIGATESEDPEQW